MKKISLLVVILLAGCFAFAQNPKVNWTDSLNHYFADNSIVALSSSLGYSAEDIEKAKSLPDSILNYTYKSSIIENDKAKGWIIRVHTAAMNTEAMRFTNMPSYWRPLVIPYKQGSVLMLRNFVSKFVYNTKTFESMKERATYAVKSMFLPLIYNLVDEEIDVKSQYIGFTFFYSHKDFSEKYLPAAYGSITIIVPTGELKKLQLFQTTDDDFLKQCDFYMKEKSGAVRFNYVLK